MVPIMIQTTNLNESINDRCLQDIGNIKEIEFLIKRICESYSSPEF